MDEITSEAERDDFNRPVLEVPTPEESARGRHYQAQMASAEQRAGELCEAAGRHAARSRRSAEASKDPGLLERVANLRDAAQARAATSPPR